MSTLECLEAITPEMVLAEYPAILRSLGKDPSLIPATREQAAAVLERVKRELVDAR